MAKSPTYSCISYELFVGGEKGNDDNNKEKMSIRSVEVESESVSVIQRQPAPTTAPATKVRKVSTVSTTQLANVLSKFSFYLLYSTLPLLYLLYNGYYLQQLDLPNYLLLPYYVTENNQNNS